MKQYKSVISSILCLFVVCGCHKATKQKDTGVAEYNNGDYYLRFSYPAKWDLMEDTTDDSLHLNMVNTGEFIVEVNSRKSLDLMFGTMNDNFENFMEYESQVSASHVFTSTKEVDYTNCAGYEFTFTMKKQKLKGVGFYTSKFNYYYGVFFQADVITDAMYHQMVSFVTNMVFYPPDPLSGNEELGHLYGVKTITNRNEMVQLLEYGRVLLQNRNLDARYYYMAKEQFYIVLLSLTKSNANTRLYQDAWALLQVADNMQLEANQRQTFDMERNVAMGNYEAALMNALYLTLLYPEHTRQHKEAQQQFYKIKDKIR